MIDTNHTQYGGMYHQEKVRKTPRSTPTPLTIQFHNKTTASSSKSCIINNTTSMVKSISSIGHSIILSSFLALLSYVPFEKVAKASLICCAITFINDPIPPTSRFVSVFGILVVLLLSKVEAKWKAGQDLKHLETLESKRSEKKD